MNFTSYNLKTNFGCSGVTEFPATNNVPLVSSIVLPDGSKYVFTYEQTLGTGNSAYVTGRVASVTLPTGGKISYSYTSGTNPQSNGIECPDGSGNYVARTVSPDGGTTNNLWTYTRSGSSPSWTTTIQDPSTPSNKTVVNFEQDTSAFPNNFYETQRKVYQGSSTLLSTSITCYNGISITAPANCPTTAVAAPILRTTAFNYLPDATGVQAETDSTYDQFGLIHEVDDYDYGNAVVGPVIRKTITGYAALGNGIVDRPSSVTIEDGSNNVAAVTSYSYDETAVTATTSTPQHISITGNRGNVTTVAAKANSATFLYRKFSYYDTGLLNTSTDVSTSSTTNGATTTYNYTAGTSSCGNSFVTSISEPLSLSRSMTWNCDGGVLLSLKDENLNTSSTTYTDPYFWRPSQTTDFAGNITTFAYPNANQNESTLSFNGGGSVTDILTTLDGLGRSIFSQKKQGPSASNYDTTATCYDAAGHISFTSLPYSATAATSATPCPSVAGKSHLYDAFNRNTGTSDSGGGSTTYTYTKNDVYQSTGPAPIVSKQLEYDGLGRLSSVCEITSGTSTYPNGTCAQTATQTGYWTKYAYDGLGDRTGVTQNAQSSTTQSRAYAYDMLGRITSEINPETNNTAYTYAYDALTSDASCGTITSAANLVKRVDAAGNSTCYTYDSIHRVLSTIYPSTATPAKFFVYDSATVSGTSVPNAKTRLAEAYTCTGTCSSKITDLGFGYSPTGQTTDSWEKTPNSGSTYYHIQAAYWPNGALNTLSGLPGLPTTVTYNADGEGRPTSVSATTGQNPVTSVSYNSASQVTGITYGSSDNDSFTYDTNTPRQNQYTFNYGSTKTVQGKLTWNQNGTLQQLVISDPSHITNSQTCAYGYDDLARLASANCGTTKWSQTFTYDPFGNITKFVPSGSTGMAFQPTYDITKNQITSTPPFAYDGNNGNLSADFAHTYTWDSEGKMITVDSGTTNGICLTYDALGRMVEQGYGASCNSSYQQIVYSPSGGKLALMNGSTLTKGFVSLPRGRDRCVPLYRTLVLQAS